MDIILAVSIPTEVKIRRPFRTADAFSAIDGVGRPTGHR